MKENVERQLNKEGYKYSLRDERWSKVLEDDNVGVPGIGNGHYKKAHFVEITDSGFTIPSLTDGFTMEDGQVAMLREIKPYPFDQFGFTAVKVIIGEETGREHFEECEFNCKQLLDQTTEADLSVWNQGLYRASYNKDGDIKSLNVASGDTFVSFALRDGCIQDSDSNPLVKLPEYLNTDKRFLYNERLYAVRQTLAEVVVEVFHPIGNQRLVSISVPPKVSIPNLTEILTRETKEWLQLLEHIPVRVIIESPRKI